MAGQTREDAAVAGTASANAPLVVFLAHAADRTGPPVVLLHILRWLRRHTDWRLVVVLLRGGELLDQFEALGTVHLVPEPVTGPITDPDLAAEERRRIAAVRAELGDLAGADLVYVNTAWSITALRYLPIDPKRPLVAAIHELHHDLGDSMPPSALADLFGRPHHFVAGAEVIARHIVEHHGVEPAQITVVPEPIELPDLDAPAGLTRSALGLDPGDFVVMAAGTPVWRKGPDLFVHLYRAVQLMRPDIRLRFVWLGADPSAGHAGLVTPLADRDRLGLQEAVTFLAPTPLVFDHLRLADVFVLTSREDASPLVCLEAAATGLPVVCFDSGGMPEILGPDASRVVPFPDLDAMASALIDLHDDEPGRRATGRAAQARVRAGHDVEQVGPLMHATIAPWLASAARR